MPDEAECACVCGNRLNFAYQYRVKYSNVNKIRHNGIFPLPNDVHIVFTLSVEYHIATIVA